MIGSALGQCPYPIPLYDVSCAWGWRRWFNPGSGISLTELVFQMPPPAQRFSKARTVSGSGFTDLAFVRRGSGNHAINRLIIGNGSVFMESLSWLCVDVGKYQFYADVAVQFVGGDDWCSEWCSAVCREWSPWRLRCSPATTPSCLQGAWAGWGGSGGGRCSRGWGRAGFCRASPGSVRR